MRKTRRLLLTALLAAGLSLASPAGAIIDGAPDGNAHPYVAAVGPAAPLMASGVLISPTVVLTAAHVAARRLGPGAVSITFDPVADESATWYTGTAHLHPAWNPQRADDPHDLAVVVLDSPVVGVTPAALPTAGMFDTWTRADLRGADFELVGYGISRLLGGANGGGAPFPDFASAGIRRVADQDVTSLTKAWLTYLRPGGTSCAGDSGGPLVLSGPEVVAAVTVRGDAACKSQTRGLRVDTPSARAFLASYVSLP